MRRVFYIVLAAVVLSLCGIDDSTRCVAQPCDSIESLYREQLKEQRRCSSDAVPTRVICLQAPTAQSVASVVRFDGGASASLGWRELPIGASLPSVEVYRLSSGCRASDHYLYALCRLRI